MHTRHVCTDRPTNLYTVYLANLIQWHTPCRTLRSASANLLSVTRCNISFGARGFRSTAPTIWNSLPSHVRSCETLTTFRRHLKSHFPLSFSHCLVTNLSVSNSFSTMALYKSIYLFTYQSTSSSIKYVRKGSVLLRRRGEVSISILRPLSP